MQGPPKRERVSRGNPSRRRPADERGRRGCCHGEDPASDEDGRSNKRRKGEWKGSWRVFRETGPNKIVGIWDRGVSRCMPAGGARLRHALPRGSANRGLYAARGGRAASRRYRTQPRRNQIDADWLRGKGEAGCGRRTEAAWKGQDAGCGRQGRRTERGWLTLPGQERAVALEEGSSSG